MRLLFGVCLYLVGLVGCFLVGAFLFGCCLVWFDLMFVLFVVIRCWGLFILLGLHLVLMYFLLVPLIMLF